MSADESDPPQNLPSSEHSAYEYSLDCSFQALHSPNIDLLVQMLQKDKDCIRFRNKIEILSDEGRKLLVSSQFWDPFTKKEIIGVKCCLTWDKE